MAKTASIPITNHGDACTSRYVVEFRPTGSVMYQKAPDQYDTPVVINGLNPSTGYDYRITRYCCDGLVSTAATGSFTTPA